MLWLRLDFPGTTSTSMVENLPAARFLRQSVCVIVSIEDTRPGKGYSRWETESSSSRKKAYKPGPDVSFAALANIITENKHVYRYRVRGLRPRR